MRHNNFSVRILGGSEMNGGYVEIDHNQNYSIQLRNDHTENCDAEVYIDGNPVGNFRVNAKSSMKIDRPSNEQKKFCFLKSDSKAGKKAGLSKDNSDLGLVKVVFTPERKYGKDYVRPLTPMPQWQYDWTVEFPPYEYNSVVGYKYDDHRHTTQSTTTQSTNDGNRRVYFNRSLTCDIDDFPRTGMQPKGKLGNISVYADESYKDYVDSRAGGTGLKGKSYQEFEDVPSIRNYDFSLQTAIHLRLILRKKEDPNEVTAIRPVTHSTPIPPQVD